MFERYTESARRTLFFARYEVSHSGAREIGTEHLLLGVLRQSEGLAGGLLAHAKVSREAIRRDIESGAGTGEQLSTSVEVPFSGEAQAALRAAAEEADRLAHGYIGTEHLLLGLLRVEGSRAATILATHGLRLADARQKLVELLGQSQGADAIHLEVRLETGQAVDVYTRLLEAWNRRDAAAFAGLFAATGSAVGFDGSQMNGRDEIERELRAVFASHATASYVARVREVRPLGEQAVLLRAVAGMVPPGKDELNPAVNAVQSVVFVRESDHLRIALLQNTPAAFHGRPELARQLTDELTDVLRSGRVVDNGI